MARAKLNIYEEGKSTKRDGEGHDVVASFSRRQHDDDAWEGPDSDIYDIGSAYDDSWCSFLADEDFKESKRFKRFVDKTATALKEVADATRYLWDDRISIATDSVYRLAGAIASTPGSEDALDFIEGKTAEYMKKAGEQFTPYERNKRIPPALSHDNLGACIENGIITPRKLGYNFSDIYKNHNLAISDVVSLYRMEVEPLGTGGILDVMCYSAMPIDELDAIARYELEELCFTHLIKSIMNTGEDIDEDNFITRCAITDAGDLWALFDQWVFRLERDVSNYTAHKAISKEIDERLKATKRNYKKALSKAKAQAESAATDAERAKEENKRLSHTLEQSTKKYDLYAEEVAKELLDNSRTIRDQERQIQELQEKLEKAQTIAEIVEDEIKTSEEPALVTPVRDIDHTSNVIFVYSEDDVTGTVNKLLQRYPNAKVCKSRDAAEAINVYTTDLVVLLTHYISHHLYYTTKNICRRREIPMLYCHLATVDSIDTLIQNGPVRNGK